ncbi:hypothetical protein CU097_007652 [Rhizopus azygosporus]|uniref:Uncharacterized protein n=1 Tax=Rhizopus azygosporus TaxID=86630 RepID=A0A367JB90_RHIAZ|nr:hypothetical protein CU097_007652 [Rhizopus azygosporus]
MNNPPGGGPVRRKDPRLVQQNVNRSLINNTIGIIKPAGTIYPSSVTRDPFGPPLFDEKRQNTTQQEYNMNQTMKAALNYANSTSFGFYISKPSVHNNNIIPCIPRF